MLSRTASHRQWVSPEPLMDDKHEDLSILTTSEHIHPYVEQDLKDSQKVEFYLWIEAVFGMPRARIAEWTSQIGEQDWFFDSEIQTHLREYCEAAEEPERYGPFCGLANRILSLAHENLLRASKNDSFPIDTVQFINISNCMVSQIPQHAQLGAQRYLDITLTHREAVSRFQSFKQLDWADILHFVEVKFVDELTDVLEEEIEERRSASTQSAARKPREKRTRRPGKKFKAETRSTAVHAGTKRRRDVVDPREALTAGSSCAQRTSPKYGIYQGKVGALQSGSYALELLSCTYGTRTCCHSTVLKDDELCLWHYDACGIIYTDQYLSLINDFEKTAATLVALASCTPERFGILPTSIIKPPTPYPKYFLPRTLTDNVLQVCPETTKKRYKITLQDSLYTQYVLAGRRTFAYSMKSSPQLSKQSLMAKFSYQVNTRRPEYEYIDIARKAGVDHLPQYHMWADLWKMSDGARRVFFADVEETPYEDRTLRMIVYTKYGSIETLFAERCDLIPVMVNQLVNCLHDLRYRANILHRDISVNNIMFEKRGEQYHFILNDFDMATLLPTEDGAPYTPSTVHRTGTLPFMAWSLLRDAFLKSTRDKWQATRHLLAHDYESLFWVSFWCVSALFLDYLSEEERNENRNVLKSLEGPDIRSVYRAKLDLCTNLLHEEGTITLAPPTLCLVDWFDGWTQLLYNAHDTARRQKMKMAPADPSNIDPDTANNALTRDSILQTLTPLMPSAQDKRDDSDDSKPEASTGRTAAPKRQSRRKQISVQAESIRAAVMSRLRPRRKAA